MLLFSWPSRFSDSMQLFHQGCHYIEKSSDIIMILVMVDFLVPSYFCVLLKFKIESFFVKQTVLKQTVVKQTVLTFKSVKLGGYMLKSKLFEN